MNSLLSVLASPGLVLGVLVGIAAAWLFHWLAPVGTDTASAGAWLVVICAAVGLALELLKRKEKR